MNTAKRTSLMGMLKQTMAAHAQEPDAVLLHRFAQVRDEAAFSTLVMRHHRFKTKGATGFEQFLSNHLGSHCRVIRHDRQLIEVQEIVNTSYLAGMLRGQSR